LFFFLFGIIPELVFLKYNITPFKANEAKKGDIMYLDKTTSIDECIKAFDTYLHDERELTDSYRQLCCRIVKLFLQSRYGNLPVCVSLLKPHDIISFVLSYSKKESPKRTQGMASVMRSFLRFLTLQYGAIDFTGLIPAVAVWSQGQIPVYLTEPEIKKLLNHCDRTTQKGLQDHIILRLLYSLGLRVSEVANLTLDDFHWDTGELSIHGKGSRLSKMPLSQDLGDDLVNYLRQGRPLCDSIKFFISSKLKALTGNAISKMVSGALKKAGLYHKKGMAAHVLRHSLATHLLQKGATMQQISEVLRHQSLDSTQIYAKVDFKRLKSIAPPWPKAWNPGGAT
jgi:site-specific recombinase XerD